MAIRQNHYDAAFEEYLRWRRIPYLSIDETRRALLADSTLKSMDFIVPAAGGQGLLVDVKGRQFPTGGSKGRRWENWATDDDLRSLRRWQELFGAGFRSVLLFAYHITDLKWWNEFDEVFSCENRFYSFYAVDVGEYDRCKTRRSPGWSTFTLSTRTFRNLRTPIDQLLLEPDREIARQRGRDGVYSPQNSMG